MTPDTEPSAAEEAIYQASLEMKGPLGALAFGVLEGLRRGGAPEATLEAVQTALFAHFAQMSDAQCETVSRVVYRRLHDVYQGNGSYYDN